MDETIEILNGLKPKFEEHHSVTYAPEALHAAAELADRHINDRRLPDKAIDVVDEAGARLRLKPDLRALQRVEVRAHRGSGRRIAASRPRRSRPPIATCCETSRAASSW